MFSTEKRIGERIMMNIKQGKYRGTRNVSKIHRNKFLSERKLASF